MLELVLPATPTPAQIKVQRVALDREIGHPVKTILLVRPRDEEDLGAFAGRAEARTIGVPNREVVWIKDARIFRRGQEAAFFADHDDACAAVLATSDDRPVAWLASGAGLAAIDRAFRMGETS